MQQLTTVLQLTTACLVFWIGVSDALTCYKCDFTSKDVNAISNCTDPAANSAYVPTCDGKACTKTYVKCTEANAACGNDVGIFMSRGCDTGALDNGYCCSASYSSGKVKTASCACTGDKCNVGESVLKSASLVVLASLAFVPYITSFIGSN